MKHTTIILALLFIYGASLAQTAVKPGKTHARPAFHKAAHAPVRDASRNYFEPRHAAKPKFAPKLKADPMIGGEGSGTIPVERKQKAAAPNLGGEGSGIIPMDHKPKPVVLPAPKPKTDSAGIHH